MHALVLAAALAAFAPSAAPGAPGLGVFGLSAGPGIPCSNGARPQRAAAVRGAGPWAPPADTTGFVVFGWVSPPADSTTEARIAEMAAIGLNLMVPAWLDEGCPDDNLARLDWAEAHGMRCLIWDSRLNGAVQWLPTFEDSLDQVVAEYRDHPAFWGYYLGDEPPREEWPMMARLRAALRVRDPLRPGWNNLSGRVIFASRDDFEAHLRDYAEPFSPVVMSADHYDFRTWGDYGQFVENLAVLREVADERQIPFWNILQLVPHANIRPLNPGELRWQVAQSLAYGARGIGYFTYWTPAPDPDWNWQPSIITYEGQRTGWYDFLLGFNPGVRSAGETLARARHVRTAHAGSVPLSGVPFEPGAWLCGVKGRAAIGEFLGPAGERLVLVANADSLASRVVALETRDAPGARLLASGSSPDALAIEPLAAGARLTLSLAAGDFVLLALDPPLLRASLEAAPNPARGAVRFSLRGPAGGARLTIADLSGRVVWFASLAPATGEIEWRGQRLDGRSVRPGVYFARFTVAGSAAATRRFVWLGER